MSALQGPITWPPWTQLLLFHIFGTAQFRAFLFGYCCQRPQGPLSRPKLLPGGLFGDYLRKFVKHSAPPIYEVLRRSA